MAPRAPRCLLALMAVLWAGGRSVGQPADDRAPPPPQTPLLGTAPDAEQLLRLIVYEVTSQVQPLVSKLATRVEGLDSRLISLGSRLDGIESRVNTAIDSKYSSVDGRLDSLVSADSRLESQQQTLASRLDELAGRVDSRAPNSTAPRDCSELPAGALSGVHTLRLGPEGAGPAVAAYCDQDSDGGGWTVIQRRADVEPRLSFDRDWAAYREGFGELDSEFWWGLEKLWRMTGPRDRQYQLRVELADFEGERRHAVYQRFRVASGANGYQLTVDGYSGDAGDSMKNQNGKKFSTKDRDQDGFEKHCAKIFSGGWWFSSCYRAYLNGLYLLGQQETRTEGINWGSWKGYDYSLKESEMKIRPVSTD